MERESSIMIDGVRHPFIPNWEGQRGWTAPGEQPSTFFSFQTEAGIEPFRITHNRDMMFEGDGLMQDYNFIDYLFGDPEHPVRGRHYLGDDGVCIFLPDTVEIPATTKAALTLLPQDILHYFQRRFGRVSIMTNEGYADISSAHD
jgi:hypothetical protein